MAISSVRGTVSGTSGTSGMSGMSGCGGGGHSQMKGSDVQPVAMNKNAASSASLEPNLGKQIDVQA